MRIALSVTDRASDGFDSDSICHLSSIFHSAGSQHPGKVSPIWQILHTFTLLTSIQHVAYTQFTIECTPFFCYRCHCCLTNAIKIIRFTELIHLFSFCICCLSCSTFSLSICHNEVSCVVQYKCIFVAFFLHHYT